MGVLTEIILKTYRNIRIPEGFNIPDFKKNKYLKRLKLLSLNMSRYNQGLSHQIRLYCMFANRIQTLSSVQEPGK